MKTLRLFTGASPGRRLRFGRRRVLLHFFFLSLVLLFSMGSYNPESTPSEEGPSRVHLIADLADFPQPNDPIETDKCLDENLLEEECSFFLVKANVLASGEYYLCLSSEQPTEFVSWFVQQGALGSGAQTSTNPTECFTFPAGSNSFFIRQYLANDTCINFITIDTINTCPEKLFEIIKISCDTTRIAFLNDVRNPDHLYYVDWGDGTYSSSKSDTIEHVYTSCPSSDICVTLSASADDASYFTCCYFLDAYHPVCYCQDISVSLIGQNCKDGKLNIDGPAVLDGLSMTVRIGSLDTLTIHGDTMFWYDFPDFGSYEICLDYTVCSRTNECCKVITLPETACQSANFSFTRKESSPSCINPCYNITPSCPLEGPNIHVWEMEDSTIFYGENPPECFMFSDFVNTDGEVCVRHYIIYCDSIIADTTKCVQHPNGAWLGRPGEERRLSDTMKNSLWGETVHDFLVYTQSGPNYPKLDGDLILDESHLYSQGRWYFGNQAKVINEHQYFGLDSMRLQSAWRLDVNAFSGCCFWIGIESDGHTYMDWDGSTLSDAHFLLHYPSRSSSIPPVIDIKNNLMHTNIFGVKSVSQNVNVTAFHNNTMIGENAAYSRNIPCGCSAINGIDFREITPNERVIFPNTGDQNIIQNYEHGFHFENARLHVRNFSLYDLKEMGIPGPPSGNWVNTFKEGRGISYTWTKPSNSSLNLDEMEFDLMDVGVIEEILGGGLHDLDAKASSRRSSISFDNMAFGYDIDVRFSRIDALIQANSINADGTGIQASITGEDNNLFQVTDNSIISGANANGDANGVILRSGWEQPQQFRVRLNDVETAATSDGFGIWVTDTENSIIEHNNISAAGDGTIGIGLDRGGNSVVKCNDVDDVDIGIQVVNSKANDYVKNYLTQNNHDLTVTGDVQGNGGSVIRWNTMDQSGEESVFYEDDAITGPQHHNMFNSWKNQNNPGIELRYFGSASRFNEYWFPEGAALGTVYRPNSTPGLIFVSANVTYDSPPLGFCGWSTEPDTPLISTPQFLGYPSDSVYTAILQDSAAFDSLTEAQRMDFDLGLFELILKNPSWKSGNTVLTDYYDSLAVGYVGSSVALKDSLSNLLSALETQRLIWASQQSEIDSIGEIIEMYYDSISNCANQACEDNIESILIDLQDQSDSIQVLIDSIANIYATGNVAAIDSLISWNSTLSDTALYQWSERRVINITLKLMKNDTLTTQDKTDLETIASYCDEDAGRSVYTARVLCWMLYEEFYWEPDCVQPSSLIGNSEFETPANSLTLYPNPTKDGFTATWDEDPEDRKYWNLEVYDLTGRMTKSLPSVLNGVNVSTTGLDDGIYIIVVRSNTEIRQAKLMKID